MTYKDGDVTSYVSPKKFFYLVYLRFWEICGWIGLGLAWIGFVKGFGSIMMIFYCLGFNLDLIWICL